VEVGHTRASKWPPPPVKTTRGQNEELDRLTYQGGPFLIIKVGHTGALAHFR
jgi:hypothetical protein